MKLGWLHKIQTFALSVAALLLLCGMSVPVQASAVYQWSVKCASLRGRRAYLWIPPKCQRVRGLIVACQNMLERPLFANPLFRQICTREGLGEVLIFPGHDKGANDDKNPNHPKRSDLDIFLDPNYPHGRIHPRGAGRALQRVLNRLAAVSGYGEIRYAPIMPVGHSSAGSFVWYLYRWNPGRIFAMLPFKTAPKTDGPQGIPILEINSEWFDYGHSTSNVSSKPGDIAWRLQVRANGMQSLFGYYVDVGAGHCNVSNKSMKIVSLFIQAAVAARIPADAPRDAPPKLRPVIAQSGWLLNPATLGKPGDLPVQDQAWHGDPRKAFWYLTRQLAAAVQNQMQTELARKPQQIGFVQHGKVSFHGGMYSLSPTFLSDGATFRVHAVFINHLTATDIFPHGTILGHDHTRILYKVTSGGLIQTGPNTFRICPHAGPLLPQGNPWEPVLVAYNSGSRRYQPTVHPAHINIHIFNTSGRRQTLKFPPIPNQHRGHLAPVELQATASSGLPVEYFMVSGPAKIKGHTLIFTRIPVRARFPLRVIVGAYQWGREINPSIRSTGPVIRKFFITR